MRYMLSVLVRLIYRRYPESGLRMAEDEAAGLSKVASCQFVLVP